MSQGIKIAAYYSYPSYSLGFCGPQDKKSRKILYDYICNKPISEKSIRNIFEKFEAAYSYYKLIAKKNNISDPLNEKVVRAFWVGNNLLDKITKKDIQKLILTEFNKPGLLNNKEAKQKALKVPIDSVPHHSFHVLILGAIAKRIKLEGVLIDLCRIGWGKVIKLKIQHKKLIIKYKPLTLSKKITLKENVEKEIKWSRKTAPYVKVGDWVSFHWGEACEVLDKNSLKNLKFYTQKTINLVNGQNR